MTTQIVKRIDKGLPLTYLELDANFENLRTTADTTKGIVDGISAVLSSSTATIDSLTPNQPLDESIGGAPRTAKYIIQMSYENNIHIEEILVTSDGINSYISEYGVIAPNDVLANFSVDYDTDRMRLLITPLFQPLKISFVKQVLL